MPWWGWIVVGAALLGSELFIDSAFYLVFLGIAAVAVGLGGLAGLTGPVWVQWLMFAALAVALMVGFRQRVYAKIRGPGGHVGDAVVGELVRVQEALDPGSSGAAELRGSVWQARNAGRGALAAGASARVVAVEGVVLVLDADPAAASGPRGEGDR